MIEKSKPQPATPLAGIFSAPCGAWVRPFRFRSGLMYWQPMIGPTRRAMGVARQK